MVSGVSSTDGSTGVSVLFGQGSKPCPLSVVVVVGVHHAFDHSCISALNSSIIGSELFTVHRFCVELLLSSWDVCTEFS